MNSHAYIPPVIMEYLLRWIKMTTSWTAHGWWKLNYRILKLESFIDFSPLPFMSEETEGLRDMATHSQILSEVALECDL